MNIEVLLSTMHQTDYSILDKINLESDAVIVNQCASDSIDHFRYNGHAITWINSSLRGLSKSRNVAMDNASAEICLLADSDEVLIPGYSSSILDAFVRHPDATIIGFQAEGIESTFKKYPKEECKVGYFRSMRMASVEIAIKRQSLLDAGIRFNELIGSGTKYKMGEENTMLFKSLAAGMNIYYVPRLICRIHIGDSTWFTGFDESYFSARGAVFAAMSTRWARLLILQFAIRKYYLYKSSMSIFSAYRLMMNGRKEFLKIQRDDY